MQSPDSQNKDETRTRGSTNSRRKMFGSQVVTGEFGANINVRASAPSRGEKSCLHRCAGSISDGSSFDVFSAVVILVNTVLIGIETEHISKHGRSADSFRTAQLALNVWFIVELIIRIAIEQRLFLTSRDRHWNIFDTLMAGISVLDLAVDQNVQIGRTVRVIRLVRITRALRILRVLRSLSFLREFRKMIFALLASVPTLCWSLVLLLFVMYTFAVWLTQGVSSYMTEEKRQHNDLLLEDLDEYFGTLGKTISTLYMSVTNGMSWGEAAFPLLEVSGVYMMLFVMFISITFFGVLNIIMSVFVESAMQSAQNSREMLIEEQFREKEIYAEHLKSMFAEIDTDVSGTITETELAYSIDENLSIQNCFEALEINATDARKLFRLLDVDDSGEVDCSEFCDGCLQIRGEASSFDVKSIMYEFRRMQLLLQKFMSHVEDELHQLACESVCIGDDMKRMSMPVPAVGQNGDECGADSHAAQLVGQPTLSTAGTARSGSPSQSPRVPREKRVFLGRKARSELAPSRKPLVKE